MMIVTSYELQVNEETGKRVDKLQVLSSELRVKSSFNSCNSCNS